MANFILLAYSTRRVIVRLTLFSLLSQCWKQRSVLWNYLHSSKWTIRNKVVKETWGRWQISVALHPHLAGRWKVPLVEAPPSGSRDKLSRQVVLKSGVMYRFNKEAMKNIIKSFWDVVCYSGSSAWELPFIETGDQPISNGKQGQRGRVPWFEAVLGRVEFSASPWWPVGGRRSCSIRFWHEKSEHKPLRL